MTETGNNSPKIQENRKSTPVGMIALSIILAAALIFLVVMYFDQKSKMTEMEIMLTQEKDSLANELRLMVASYDTLKSNNDTLNASLQKEKKRIIQLLSINASNTQLIRKYKSEISTMRNIMKSYIVQIDSLNTRNKVLVAENTQIKQDYTKVQGTNVELEKVKKELNSKVEIASVIQAKDIAAAALNKRQKETSRLSLLDKLRICFTLRENPIALAGRKEVFMRVLRPDSLVIASGPDNLFDYRGSKLVYSANRSADYMNQDIEMCIFLGNNGDFIPGNYSVELYLEDNIIGRTTFMLTKR
jgi:FlaG/FlaF family flagellin (archaellin)